MEDDALMFFADGIAPVRRSHPDQVFHLRIEAIPQASSADFGQVGGAFVNCYVDVDDLRSAEQSAIGMIQDDGWQPRRFVTWKLVGSDEESSETTSESIKQAKADGFARTFYCWPVDAPDADDPDA